MQEYFLNKQESLFPDAQVDMALTCLQYLSFDAFKRGHDVSPSYKYPFILYAAIHWGHHARTNEEATFDVLQMFLSRKPNVVYATALLLTDKQHGLGYPIEHWTDFGEIHLLSFFGLGKMISQLLKINHSADSKDSWGQTPLSHAATQGHSEVVQLLLTRDDVDANSMDEDYCSPLSYATQNGNLEAMKLLLARDDIDVNSEDGYCSPLSYATENGNLEAMKLLLAQDNIKVNPEDKDCSPLSYAAENGDLKAMKLLLARTTSM